MGMLRALLFIVFSLLFTFTAHAAERTLLFRDVTEGYAVLLTTRLIASDRSLLAVYVHAGHGDVLKPLPVLSIAWPNGPEAYPEITLVGGSRLAVAHDRANLQLVEYRSPTDTARGARRMSAWPSWSAERRRLVIEALNDPAFSERRRYLYTPATDESVRSTYQITEPPPRPTSADVWRGCIPYLTS